MGSPVSVGTMVPIETLFDVFSLHIVLGLILMLNHFESFSWGDGVLTTE